MIKNLYKKDIQLSFIVEDKDTNIGILIIHEIRDFNQSYWAIQYIVIILFKRQSIKNNVTMEDN